MAIDFSPARWDRLRETYDSWWAGTLDRPIIPIWLGGRDPGRPKPDVPLLSQATCHRLDIPASEIVDRLDWELSCRYFLGDSFPFVNLMSFGPGVMAAFCGAELDNSTGNVWFRPADVLPIEEIHFEYDAANVWLKRILEICREATKRWQGQVLIGMPDLGGGIDMLATFRSTENLLMDLYDSPGEVTRLMGEIHEVWHRYYAQIAEALSPSNPGYSDWSGIYSRCANYMLQSDFSYMISPGMFDEFVRPELVASSKRLKRSMYHLDGPGQLPHLDSILRIESLNLVQWVPGDGNPDPSEWPDVYRRIRQAGKNVQMVGDPEHVATIAEQLGSGVGLCGILSDLPAHDTARVQRVLASCGIR